MEYIEIVERLIGSIHSVGSSHIDCERYEIVRFEPYYKKCEVVFQMPKDEEVK